jgi:choline dehydrogenase
LEPETKKLPFFLGMTYIRGDAAQFDAWEQLGNTGWNWTALLSYFKKSERYTIPTFSQVAAGATYNSQYHGFGGPVRVGYSPALVNGSFAPTVSRSWEAMSLTRNPDLNSGDVKGFATGPQTLDRALNMRWDSTRAYYYPIEYRRNLKIIKGTATRIVWAERIRDNCTDGIRWLAIGVEYITDSGATATARASSEVILSAGALRTPLLLESSGIFWNPRFGNWVQIGPDFLVLTALITADSRPLEFITLLISLAWERISFRDRATPSHSQQI